MKRRIRRVMTIGIALMGIMMMTACGNIVDAENSSKVELINVSYDPTREFFESYNKIFTKHWKKISGQDATIIQSHGGSGKQALEVVNGLEADVVTLALEYDIDAIENEGMIDEGWIDEYDNDSSPYTSTIVFLVRKGNPKGIKDWDDLTEKNVGIITPNPKTSGGARWNYMAAWAYADEKYSGDEDKMKDFISKIYGNVLVLDSGARGATTSFVVNGQGDVLIAWENEAYLSMQDYPGEFEIVTPSVSILAQPSVAVVDSVARYKGTEKAAAEYINYFYSDEAQRIAAGNYFRPSNEDVLKEYSDIFDLNVKMATINDFGGWKEVQKKHFSEGGIFDSIYS